MKKGEWSKETKMLSGILGNNVRALRIQQKISQETLAERSGLSTNEIGKIECEKVKPGFTVLVSLAKGLGLGIDTLLTPDLDVSKLSPP